MNLRICVAAAVCLLVIMTVLQVPAAAQTAHAALKDAHGQDVGTVDLIETSSGVLLKLAVNGLKPGEHAVHIHAIGKCEPPFESAGGHFNPATKKHGLLVPQGPHAGDMPNLHVLESGEVNIEILNPTITLEKDKPNSVLGPDGTAIVIHAGVDDYKSDPAGNAGGRVVCGVILQGT
jgi:superoxide dismutase, Cu-Zn family